LNVSSQLTITCFRPTTFRKIRPGAGYPHVSTNIGLYLLSTVSARDLGWIGTIDALERLEATIDTMGRLQQCHGHFYNWYDTRDLRALEPRYVSSVDSGNLAAHLIVVANAAREWIDTPVTPQGPVAGVRDALLLAREAFHALPNQLRNTSALCQQLDTQLGTIAVALEQGEDSWGDGTTRLQDLAHPRPHSRIWRERSPATRVTMRTAICSSGRTRPTAPSAGVATPGRRRMGWPL
jgi:hypothetical protein